MKVYEHNLFYIELYVKPIPRLNIDVLIPKIYTYMQDSIL